MHATVVLDERPVLRAVDLDLPPGITVLRGPNGSGKTTALRALAGLLPIARGERDAPDDVLYLGHRPQLLHGLTARENLAFFRAFRGSVGSPAAPLGVDDALELWGIRRDADRPVEHLSAGQRRRAALARLEVETCALALLDEPFAELDDDAAAVLRATLARLAHAGSAVVVASHGHHDLDDVAVRVCTLREGKLET